MPDFRLQGKDKSFKLSALRRQKFTFNNMNPHWSWDEIRYGARVVAAVDRTRLQDDKNGFTIGIVSLCFVFQVEYNVFNFILFFRLQRANFAKIQPILCYLSKIRQAGAKLLIKVRAMKSSKVCLFVHMVGWIWLLYWISYKILGYRRPTLITIHICSKCQW